MAEHECSQLRELRDLQEVVYGDKKKNIKGLVEQVSECKEASDAFNFWRKFVSIIFAIGAASLVIIRSLKGILW